MGALGLGAYGIRQYNKVNKNFKNALDAYTRRTGRIPGQQVYDNLKKSSINATTQQSIGRASSLFQPEITTRTRGPGGRFGPMVTTQQRGSVRQWVKDKVSGVFKNHPILRDAAIGVGRDYADRIHTRIVNPTALHGDLKSRRTLG